MTTPTYAEAVATLAAQAFSRHLGMELTAFTAGDAELIVPITAELLQQRGVVHGGVIAALADNASAFAGGSLLGPSVATSGFHIDYLRPATGQRLRAVATVVSCSARRALCRCEVYSQTRGRPSVHCASVQAVVAVVEPRSGSDG